MATITSDIPYIFAMDIDQTKELPDHLKEYNAIKIIFPHDGDGEAVIHISVSIGDIVTVNHNGPHNNRNRHVHMMDYWYGTVQKVLAPSLDGFPPKVYVEIRWFYRRQDVLATREKGNATSIAHTMLPNELLDSNYVSIIDYRTIASHVPVYKFTREVSDEVILRVSAGIAFTRRTAEVDMCIRRSGGDYTKRIRIVVSVTCISASDM
ncbi:hypothetical protein JVU11DRAFT_9280 [Chiua virens]|nr:hypothetical protein JVU11DRAFT_9280 [Chiua virens]